LHLVCHYLVNIVHLGLTVGRSDACAVRVQRAVSLFSLKYVNSKSVPNTCACEFIFTNIVNVFFYILTMYNTYA
jgi:hypothetical protein